ncbi:hypothetical protein SEVIR_5G308901v4 [Setaria viridis]|uniref:Uncharacterized protein n=2 Tax=Setaria TaxID=4554 RepID=A0A368RAG8_SETIT|nr:hypothetical protein SETIT_5G306100v2 [Setaria italica]TKW16583.1 hypothetical protein SEVIR_5G308901v2 [Setaria viridis]
MNYALDWLVRNSRRPWCWRENERKKSASLRHQGHALQQRLQLRRAWQAHFGPGARSAADPIPHVSVEGYRDNYMRRRILLPPIKRIWRRWIFLQIRQARRQGVYKIVVIQDRTGRFPSLGEQTTTSLPAVPFLLQNFNISITSPRILDYDILGQIRACLVLPKLPTLTLCKKKISHHIKLAVHAWSTKYR